jgi:hypothetical protein
LGVVHNRCNDGNFDEYSLVIWMMRNLLKEFLVLHALGLEPDATGVIEYFSHLKFYLDGGSDQLCLNRVEVDMPKDEGAESI